ncbi:hypothetical protein [Rhodococcus sp. ARC_M5]|uniref:hypothetical protein n=1 Tax=Rhodococcus sp. ARC_M5 TaxID=2928851 RepID=UPI0035AD869D
MALKRTLYFRRWTAATTALGKDAYTWAVFGLCGFGTEQEPHPTGLLELFGQEVESAGVEISRSDGQGRGNDKTGTKASQEAVNRVRDPFDPFPVGAELRTIRRIRSVVDHFVTLAFHESK